MSTLSRFGPGTDTYLDQWLNLDTWWKSHPLDERRFFRFLKACRTFTPDKAHGGAFREALALAVLDRYPNWTKDNRDEAVSHYVHLADAIHDYHTETDRWEPERG